MIGQNMGVKVVSSKDMEKTQEFIEQMKSGNYCNGDNHMSVYITEDGRVLDGFKRLKAASTTGHPVTVKIVSNQTTRDDVERWLETLPKTCTCGKRC